MSKKRFDEIDVAKGIGIILVVFGHTITQYASNPTGVFSGIYNFVYLFHMPLMFFLSGLLCSHIIDAETMGEKLRHFRGKVKRLMIPYFFIGIVFIPINMLMSEYKRNTFTIDDAATMLIGNNPEGELWFLYVLFIFSAFAIFFVNKKNLKYITAAALVISCASPYMTPTLTSISLAFSLYQFLPFMLGIWIGSEYERILEKANAKNTLILIVMSAIPFVIYLINSKLLSIRILAALFMILIVYLFSLLIVRMLGKTTIGILKTIGIYSMDIYILHHPILVIFRILCGGNGKYPIPITAFIFIGMILSVVTTILISKYTIRKIPVVRTLILGM